MRNAEKARKKETIFQSSVKIFLASRRTNWRSCLCWLWIAFWRQTWEKYKEFRFRGRLRGVCSEFPWPFDLCLCSEMRDETWLLWWVQHKARFHPQPHPRPRTNVLSLFRLLSPAKKPRNSIRASIIWRAIKALTKTGERLILIGNKQD